VRPEDPRFTGFVFKIQANMDPRHRDRIAFVRVCSGRFEADMKVRHVRTGREIRLAAPQQFLAQARRGVEEAWPGDVVGIHDRGALRIGDTLSGDGDLEFEGIPRFSPEHFARVHLEDPFRRKQLDTGLRHLSEEGAAQVFYEDATGGPSAIVGAVGLLQFDVLLHRLRHEYGVEARLERLPYRIARWLAGPECAIRDAARGYGRILVYDARGAPLLLFENESALQTTLEREEDLTFHEIAP
jgi:peptide chain release factor 3